MQKFLKADSQDHLTCRVTFRSYKLFKFELHAHPQREILWTLLSSWFAALINTLNMPGLQPALAEDEQSHCGAGKWTLQISESLHEKVV